MTEFKYYLGVDGGGTKCKAILVNQDQQLLGEGLSGPGNPVHGIDIATNSIRDAALQAMTAAGLSEADLSSVAAGVGLAGVNLPSRFEQMLAWDHPFAAMHMTTDLHIASLGAHQGGDGAVIITGTGSSGFYDVKGEQGFYGGHGFLLSDKGSGAWAGLQAVKSVLLAYDGLGPQTQLTELIEAQVKASRWDLIEHFTGAAPSVFAKMAPLVFRAANNRDTEALRILNEGAAYISEMGHALLEHNPPRISILGGLGKYLVPYLAAGLVDKLSEPLGAPEQGAVHYVINSIRHR